MADNAYTPQFQHQPWVDHVDRLQAASFNDRFAAIEAEFRKIAQKLQEVERRLASNTHEGDLIVTGNLTVSQSIGIGTPNHTSPLTIRASDNTQELIKFENLGGATRWHVNLNVGGNKSGLNIGETGLQEGRLFLQSGGLNVGLGTTTPEEPLSMAGGAFCDNGKEWKNDPDSEN